MSDPGFPSGVGLWGMKRRGVAEGYIKIERGHTAREAYDASGLRAEYGFNELTFELVADVAPPETPAAPSPRGRMCGAERGAEPRPEVVRRVRRKLRAQGVSV